MKRYILTVPLFLMMALMASCVTVVPTKPPSSGGEIPSVEIIPSVDTSPFEAQIIKFAPSPGATSYIVYITSYPNIVNNACMPIPIGNVTSIKVSKLNLAPGVYNFGISALDKLGNESAIRLSNRAIIVVA